MKIKIGYLGPKGTFSEEACKEYCKQEYNKEECNSNGEANSEVEIIEFKTIPETITSLDNDLVDECIVPVENSLQGGVTATIDTLIEKENIKVKKELLLTINQNLMANKACKLNEITKVLSHPQAIAQCAKYLETNLKQAEIIPIESTALAAKMVSEVKENSGNIDNSKISEAWGCIGNISCLESYGLNLIQRNIQDNNSNKTKFWVLSKTENQNPEMNKMSILFSVNDKPGALYEILGIFKKYGINLTKIESRPAKTVLGEYIFLIDILTKDVSIDDAIKEIAENGLYIRILGQY